MAIAPPDAKPQLKGRGFIATGNAGKLREIVPLCHEYFQIEGEISGLAPEGAIESAPDFEGNALIKARYLRDILEKRGEKAPYWILSDDSGLSVENLGGRPGVHSARYAGDHVSSAAHMTKLISELRSSGQSAPHKAHYTCVLALIQATTEAAPARESSGEGECHGEIIFTPQGDSGFGYDPVFFVPEFGKTFAQVTYEEKNSISHRRRAFEKLQQALLLLILAIFGFLAPELHAEPLARILGSWQRDGFLQLPQLPSQLTKSISTLLSASDLERDDVKSLLKLYLPRVKAKDPTKITWAALALSPEFHLPAARPSRNYFNTHILQVFEAGKLLASFRPVDTISGCDSGCAPITFHLVLKAGATSVEVIEESIFPLQKKGHIPFTEEDRKLLASNLQKIPLLMKKLSSSAHTTDAHEQTWPVYQKTLVPGAAYTSYRIYEAALQLLETLEKSQSSRDEALEEASDLLGQAYRLQKLSDATPLWKRLVSKSGASKDGLTLEQFRSSVLAALVAWRFLENPKANLKDLSKDIRSAQLDKLPAFRCQVLETLLLEPASRVRLSAMKAQDFGECSGLRSEWVKILSSPEISPDMAAFLQAEVARLPEFILRRPELLAEVAAKVGNTNSDLRNELYSHLRAEHPRFDFDTKLSSATRVKQIEADLRQKSLARLSKDLGRFPQATLQKFEGTSPFPVKNKEIYIFFASWCPHCKQLLEMLRDELSDSKLWDKIQLVESLSSSDSLFEAQVLCSDLKLPKSACQEMLLLPSVNSNPELNAALRLASVPRVVITDPKGAIRDYDFRFEEGRYQDPLRKLKWILENH
jgi:XTP/dITP diphosphohydrolase